MIAPSGVQYEIACGPQRAVVVEVGGGLRAYSVGDRAVLDGYGADELCPSGRGQVLAPWPNRIEDGRYEFDGRDNQLPLTEPDTHNAIHGLVRWASWTVSAKEPHRVVLEHLVHPQPGYPFSLALTIEYTLRENGLSVRTTASNVGVDECPYGHGAHPYFTLGSPVVDSAVLHVPGGTVIHSNRRGLPTRTAPVADTELDFREARAIGSTVLDNAFTDLEREEDGVARVTLRDGDAELAVWADESYGYFQVFTGDPLPDVARRSVAVEPMTCPPNAFRTGEALIRLAPGGSVTTTWGIEVR